MVTVCKIIRRYNVRPMQCNNGLAKGWFINLNISLCSFVMHVSPIFFLRMAGKKRKRKKDITMKKEERKKKERKKKDREKERNKEINK